MYLGLLQNIGGNMNKARKAATTTLVATAMFVPGGLPPANADPTLSPDQQDYISRNAQRDCQVMNINPLDSQLITALIYGAKAEYPDFSGREAFAAIQEGVRQYCPNVYEIWQNPLPPSQLPPP